MYRIIQIYLPAQFWYHSLIKNIRTNSSDKHFKNMHVMNLRFCMLVKIHITKNSFRYFFSISFRSLILSWCYNDGIKKSQSLVNKLSMAFFLTRMVTILIVTVTNLKAHWLLWSLYTTKYCFFQLPVISISIFFLYHCKPSYVKLLSVISLQ